MSYYILQGNKREGPFRHDQLKSMVDAGLIDKETLFQGVSAGDNWLPVGILTESKPQGSPTPSRHNEPSGNDAIGLLSIFHGLIKVCVVVLVGLIIIGVGIATFRAYSNHPVDVFNVPGRNNTVEPQIVRLKGDQITFPSSEGKSRHSAVVLVAVDEQSLTEMMIYLHAGEIRKLFRMIESNRGTLLPSGTQAQVLYRKRVEGTSAEIVNIRIINGDLQGRSVWTHSFFVP